MSLSSVFVAGDEITASSVIDAMFDHGYYEHIILWHASGDTWIVRQAKSTGYRAWLVHPTHRVECPDCLSGRGEGLSRLGSVALKLNPGQACT